MARIAAFPLRTGVMLAAMLFASAAAPADADAGGQINDGNFPAGFDCSKLDSAKTRLECQTFQANRAPSNDVVPPGTPAFSMPGQSNSMTGPYIGSNPRSTDFTPGKRPEHGE